MSQVAMPPTTERIHALLVQEARPLNAKLISRYLGIPPSTVYGALARLEQQGKVISHRRPANVTYYQAADSQDHIIKTRARLSNSPTRNPDIKPHSKLPNTSAKEALILASDLDPEFSKAFIAATKEWQALKAGEPIRPQRKPRKSLLGAEANLWF